MMEKKEEYLRKNTAGHTKRLMTPAMYGLEMYLHKYELCPRLAKKLEMTGIVLMAEFSFLNYPPVRFEKGLPEEKEDEPGEPPQAELEFESASPEMDPAPSEVNSTRVDSGSAPETPEGKEVKDEGKPVEEPKTEESALEPKSEPALAEEKKSKSKSPVSDTPSPTPVRDPDYFDPALLLESDLGPEGSQIGTLNGLEELTGEYTNSQEDVVLDAVNEEELVAGDTKKTSNIGMQQETEDRKKVEKEKDTSKEKEDGDKPKSMESQEEEKSISNKRKREQFVEFVFNNGKTQFFSRPPLDLLRQLSRNSLQVRLWAREWRYSASARIRIDSFADAVDKSVVLVRSIPLSGLIHGTYTIKIGNERVGSIEVELRLSCFGPQLFHMLKFPDNPNEKKKMDERDRQQPAGRTSQGMIYVQIGPSAEMKALGPLTRTKSVIQIIGKVRRDISHKLSMLCGAESVPSPPEIQRKQRNIIEEEEAAKEDEKIRRLTAFPQYKCVPSWSVVFNRRVIKDLIAKNRRPFQEGGPDRAYVQRYFPELMPTPKGSVSVLSDQTPKKEKEKKKFSAEDGVILKPLKLDRFAKSPDRSKREKWSTVSQAESSTSSDLIYVDYHAPSFNSNAYSNIALFKYSLGNADEQTFSAFDSRVNVLDSRTNVVDSRANVFDHRTKDDSRKVFVAKTPVIDPNNQTNDPVPMAPLAFEFKLPRQGQVSDLTQIFREAEREISAIGGETRSLYDKNKFSFVEEYMPPHLKRPEAKLSGDTSLVHVAVEKGTTMAIPVFSTPYWNNHKTVCSMADNCPHFVLLNAGKGYISGDQLVSAQQ